jgi:hypothetical protein
MTRSRLNALCTSRIRLARSLTAMVCWYVGMHTATNLRKARQKACSAAGLGKLEEVEGRPDPRYTGLIIHDPRRSAIKNLMKAGVNEKVAMKISGHKTRDVFDRYHIVDTEDVVDAMRKVQTVTPAANNLVPSVKR